MAAHQERADDQARSVGDPLRRPPEMVPIPDIVFFPPYIRRTEPCARTVQTHFKQYERADFAVKAVTIVDLAHRWPKLLVRLLEADQAKKKENKKTTSASDDYLQASRTGQGQGRGEGDAGREGQSESPRESPPTSSQKCGTWTHLPSDSASAAARARRDFE